MKTKIKPKTKLEKNHWYHKVIIQKVEGSSPHYGKIVCIDCGKVMRWLSRDQYYNMLYLEMYHFHLEK